MDTEHLNGENAMSGNKQTGARGEGSIFSQNLELDFQSAGKARRREKPESREEAVDPAERRTYFQIEAGKVVDLLSEELERFGDVARDPELVDDLWRSWLALWGEGGETAQAEFCTLFGTFRQAFGAAMRRLSPGLAPPEKLALGRLLQAMERLAGGRTGNEDLQWCHESGNRVSRMVAAWISEGLRPEEQVARKPQGAPQDDISGSIDEWFSQVSRFIPQSPEDEPDFGAAFSTLKDEADIPGADNDVAAEEVGEAITDRTQGESSSKTDPVESADEILAAAEVDGWEMPLAEDKQPAGMAQGHETAATRDDEAEETAASSEDILIEGASEGWLAEIYFGECCLDVAETIKNNVDRLDGPGAGRTVQMLLERVEYLIQLSSDFGMGEIAGVLGSLRGRLDEISRAGRKDRSGDTRRVEELLSALDTLERECEVTAVPAW